MVELKRISRFSEQKTPQNTNVKELSNHKSSLASASKKSETLDQSNQSNKKSKNTTFKKLELFNTQNKKIDENEDKDKSTSKLESKTLDNYTKNSSTTVLKKVPLNNTDLEKNLNLLKHSLKKHLDKKKKSSKDNSIHKINISKNKVEEIDNIDSLLDNLSKKTSDISDDESPFMERFSFLDDKPKVKRMNIKNYKVNHLYTTIDSLKKNAKNVIPKDKLDKDEDLTNKNNKTKNYSNLSNFRDPSNKNNLDKNEDVPVIEEIDIPNIIAIEDISSNSDVDSKYSSIEKEDDKDDYHTSNFVEKDNKLDLNSDIKDKMKKIDDFSKRKKHLKDKDEDKLKIPHNLKKENDDESKDDNKSEINVNVNLDSKSKLPYSDLANNNNNKYQEDPELENKKKPKVENKNLNNHKVNTNYNSSVNYILPKDNDSYSKTHSSRSTTNNFINTDFVTNDTHNKYSNLVYSIKTHSNSSDLSKVHDKYNIDEFSYVNIFYKDNNIKYDLIQPELNPRQEKIFSEIKNLFLKSIDRNYYSFQGDKRSIQKYIQKIFDVVVDKLAYNLSSLDKKLYLSFIEKDFTGLGFLTTLLNDRNVLEVRCVGADTPISVYHIKYGSISTNLNFENLNKLNIFVLRLTKLMGLHVNSSNPMFSGYLPSGYKVEGLYSIGDVSSRGSSFVIKKYLEEPQTPTSFIKTGVGAIDVFAYIWTMIFEGYQVIISGEDGSNFILNSLCLFLPDEQIISVQEQDDLKLPQDNWIKRSLVRGNTISLKQLLDQSISENPDYLIVEDFNKDYFASKWYDINMLTIDKDLVSIYKNKMQSIAQKYILIDLRKVKVNNKELIQFESIKEYNSESEFSIVKIEDDKNSFKLDLLSSDINVVEFSKKKEVMRWIFDSKIYDYRDFNNIVNDYYKNKDRLLKKLGLNIKDKNLD